MFTLSRSSRLASPQPELNLGISRSSQIPEQADTPTFSTTWSRIKDQQATTYIPQALTTTVEADDTEIVCQEPAALMLSKAADNQAGEIQQRRT